VTQPDTTPIRQYSRRARIAQSSALPTVVDEPASPVRDVILEDGEGVAAKQSGDDAPDKGRSINEGEAAAERIILAGGIDVPTSSGSIPTAGPPATRCRSGKDSCRGRASGDD
nr:hypothetical protein [Tanacetum cinerariifolium]